MPMVFDNRDTVNDDDQNTMSGSKGSRHSIDLLWLPYNQDPVDIPWGLFQNQMSFSYLLPSLRLSTLIWPGG
jgi:hypothetical protein